MNLFLLTYRLSSIMFKKGFKRVARLIDGINYILFNSYVPGSVEIGRGTIFSYGGIGIVIHANAVIGEGCVIGQGITIGGRSRHKMVPKIGNEVYIGAGARILGPIVIGDNVVIGPNAVVIDDILTGSVVVGIPGRVVKSNIIMRDFI